MSRQTFIEQMAPYANHWANRTGIPAEVFIAIGASETNWGATGTFFGIKGSGPTGKSQRYKTWEMTAEGPVETYADFAVYDNPNQGFEHFIGLIQSGRYTPAWQQYQQSGDWISLLRDINNAGYATDKQWWSKIQSLAGGIGDTGDIMPEDNFTHNIAAAFQTYQAALKDYQNYTRTKGVYYNQKTNTVGKRVTPSAQAPDGWQDDVEGTQLYNRAGELQSLFETATKLAPLYKQTFDVGREFRETETTRADLAEQAWKNFKDRLSTLIELEDVPAKQASALEEQRSTALKALSERNQAIQSGTLSRATPSSFFSYRKPEEPAGDYTGFASTVRSSIPSEPPPFYSPRALPEPGEADEQGIGGLPPISFPDFSLSKVPPAEIPATEPIEAGVDPREELAQRTGGVSPQAASFIETGRNVKKTPKPTYESVTGKKKKLNPVLQKRQRILQGKKGPPISVGFNQTE